MTTAEQESFKKAAAPFADRIKALADEIAKEYPEHQAAGVLGVADTAVNLLNMASLALPMAATHKVSVTVKQIE